MALAIEAGDTTATLTVPTVDDGKYEPDGTVTARLLRLDPGGNYQRTGPTEVKVNVADDDTAHAARAAGGDREHGAE